jgi:DNA-binding SARP family transcriptional activator
MALIYSNESIKRAKLSGSEIMEQISALLLGQVLSDMNKYHEALEHFTRWIEIWKRSGFLILASSGAFEIANIYLRIGKVREARDYFKMAIQIVPEGEEAAHLNRSEEFFKKIKCSLLPSTKSESIESVQNPEDMPVCIKTFGDLEIKIGDKIIYDRTWRGGRTKALLKALIVYGGTKVSYDLLIDTLWPETDGDIAENNLKVALSRLRRIGYQKSTSLVQWILVKQKKVSFARPICAVDSIIFKETIERIFNGERNASLLKDTLDLYRDDFLVKDQNEIWIIKHREALREDFINGTILFAQMCKENGNLNEAIFYLYRALEKDSLNEEIYACLMDVYLTLGYPSKAVQIYKRAEEILKRELNITPGSTLRTLAQQAGLK